MNFDAIGFQGGGLKGLAYVGALKKLSEYGLDLKNIKNFAGTSAGSQIATYLACGYDVHELENIVHTMPVKKFKDHSIGCVRNGYRLFKNYGYFKGKFMEKYVDSLVKAKLGKKKATFKDLYEYNGTVLRITGTCLTTGELEYFDHVLTPNLSIAKAVHVSSCIPLFYASVKYKNKYYVDGGILHNLPILAFPNLKTLFLRFVDIKPCIDNQCTEQKYKIKNLLDFIYSIFEISISYSNKLSVDNGLMTLQNDVTLIDIDTKDISYIDFNMSDDTKKFLYQQGIEAIKDYVKNKYFIQSNLYN